MEVDATPDLQLFESLGLTASNFVADKESADYSAASFRLNTLKVLYRSAKITPTKNGQFVTLWKRIKNGTIQPFDAADSIDFVIISVTKDRQSGHFVFPVAELYKQKIFTQNGIGGKRAFRVYPPWDVPESRQAAKTQKWQLEFFIEISKGKYVGAKKTEALLRISNAIAGRNIQF